MTKLDLLVKGGTLVIPRVGTVRADIGISGGRIVDIGEDIPGSRSVEQLDATGKYVFPGAIDSHFHVGIYLPMKDDAVSESCAAASGGVTTILSFFRTGKNYLNRIGPYKEIFPEVLSMSEDAYVTDYSYHLAIMNRAQLSEIEWLATDAGVSQFKFYMFYKTLDLAGSSRGDSYLMVDEPLDLGFLADLMTEVARVNDRLGTYGAIRVAVHCEDPEIIRVSTKQVQETGGTGNLTRDYCYARPAWGEGLAIMQAGAIAAHTHCPINLVHLSSREAIQAAQRISSCFPYLDILNEATLHHLALSYDHDYGIPGKVNPPIRSPEDVNYLWKRLLEGYVKTVVSDHACVNKKLKQGDLWTSLPGFGGTSLIFPVMITRGFHERGLSLERIAELTSLGPALGHNLYPKKGTIAVGSDADLAIVDINEEKTVTTDILFSSQDFTPFEGMALKGWPVTTILRGSVIYDHGRVVGKPGYGQFVKTPIAQHHQGSRARN